MRPWLRMKRLGTAVRAGPEGERGRPLVKPQDPAILRGDMDQRIEQQPGHSGAWQRALAARLGAAVGPALGPPTALDGGALQRHWRIDLPVAGRVERVVLRRTGSRVLDSLPRPVEFAAQRAAWQAGVPAAEPLACGADFLVMRHLPGSADPQVALAAADPDALARDLATALARLHRVTPATAELPLAPAPADAGAATLAAYRAALDRRPRAHPVLEWGLRALEHAPPAPIHLIMKRSRKSLFSMKDG